MWGDLRQQSLVEAACPARSDVTVSLPQPFLPVPPLNITPALSARASKVTEMDRPQKQLPLRAHARNKSIPQATRPRSTTNGPLEVDDVSLSSPRPPDPNASFLSPKQGSSSRGTSPNPRSPRSPGRSPAPSPRLGPPPKKDFSFLLKPEIYHTLSPNTIPAPFRDSPHQPDPETPIPDLVARGQYRAAAVAAVQQLTGTAGHTAPSSDDHARIFSLLHTRLACLTLIDATNIAAQEVKALEDVQSPFYLANPVPTPAPCYARALLWLHLGDVDAARACVNAGKDSDSSSTPDSSRDKIISALCDMADGDYESALATWTDLRGELPRDEMVGVNTAVCLLYVGKMEQGRAILEEMVDSGYSSHTLLFNLTTMYELCTERARDEKQHLAERVAALEPSLKGWEKTNADFKL
ncbi:hypothetical protein MAPG_06319 [Magnaporthiopsis poae ATCC 64411]|uniref:Tetratricopeptide repeat protein 15 n=1 Tax=Magnaporthiopsis poae (strain ATCC 64411 / 73-15) TaxID=644358 RepID=A0A0C4E1Q2_MAGP6|nr:hypothetical protein MAPG_06319 [Magnaporthiopsis poae ATCC 64411]